MPTDNPALAGQAEKQVVFQVWRDLDRSYVFPPGHELRNFIQNIFGVFIDFYQYSSIFIQKLCYIPQLIYGI
jgi:hypothetical protein